MKRVMALAALLVGSTACLATERYQAAPAADPAVALTRDQTAKLQQLRAETLAKAEPLRAQARAKNSKILALWGEPEMNRDEIAKEEAEVEGLRQELRNAWDQFHDEALEVLTYEQRAAGVHPCKAFGCASPPETATEIPRPPPRPRVGPCIGRSRWVVAPHFGMGMCELQPIVSEYSQ